MTDVHPVGDTDGDVVIIGMELGVALGAREDVMDEHVMAIENDGL